MLLAYLVLVASHVEAIFGTLNHVRSFRSRLVDSTFSKSNNACGGGAPHLSSAVPILHERPARAGPTLASGTAQTGGIITLFIKLTEVEALLGTLTCMRNF